MWRKWRMVCPNCKGFYYTELLNPHEVETCPLACVYNNELKCQVGYKAPFKDFIDYEVISNGE